MRKKKLIMLQEKTQTHPRNINNMTSDEQNILDHSIKMSVRTFWGMIVVLATVIFSAVGLYFSQEYQMKCIKDAVSDRYPLAAAIEMEQHRGALNPDYNILTDDRMTTINSRHIH